MNSTGFRKRMQRFMRRGQSGQSIVILAVAFIALLAFVGIVTDISLLFVRYSTLHRAVDAAVVAAAVQMRRNEDTDPNPDVDTGGSTGYANMNLAARQFLELYGLNPTDVLVETCRAQLADYDADGQLINDGLEVGGEMIITPEEELVRNQELCRDNRKLVRVTASIMSPTIFLRVLGMEDVFLTAEAIGETALLDVVLVLDVSESMAEDTRYEDWEAELGHEVAHWLPGRVPIANHTSTYSFWRGEASAGPEIPVGDDPFPGVLNMSQRDLEAFARDNPTITLEDFGGTTTYDLLSRPYYPGEGFLEDDDERVTFWTDDRPECMPRFWPNAHNIYFGDKYNFSPWMLDEYRELWGDSTGLEEDYFDTDYVENPSASNPNYRFIGWAQSFDFYGCCNDPDGDGSFADLACQPFKDARDSSSRFLSRIDFPRGDGVAFVTYGRGAYVIRPGGPGTDPWIREENLPACDTPPCYDAEDYARTVLEQAVGVHAEPSFYYDDPASYSGGDLWQWNAFVEGYDLSDPNNPVAQTLPLRYPGAGFKLNDWQIGSLTWFPVMGACPFDMATLYQFASPFDDSTDPNPNPTTILYGMQLPNWLTGGVQDVVWRSYDYRASCRDGNVGAGLQATGNAFNEIPEARREGAVWVMVLLGDGAAGASNPVRRNGVDQIMTNPFQFNPPGSRVPSRAVPQPDQRYGAFGVCPFGTSGAPGELVNNNIFPFCSDEDPDSRHDCHKSPTPSGSPVNSPIDLDLGNQPTCEAVYDVDDYARDWADYVGGVTAENVQQTQLPVMFTIGFGLKYESGDCSETDYACQTSSNLDDYLGEELLRYIADTGDNFQVDDDWWQYQLTTGSPAGLGVFDPDLSTAEGQAAYYGQQGPCEDPTSAPTEHASLPPKESCGNYFWAPTQTELEIVFNEIASRMFTRLAQ